VVGVTTSDDIREFLTSRRARITPDQAGLPAYGRNRRVAGLRREEVAMLAGISVEYYTKLERGHGSGVSGSVFDGLARALQLDEAERAYLAALLHTSATPRPRRPRPARQGVRPTVQRLLDAMTGIPAYVRNGNFDILAANALGQALYAPLYDDPARPVNSARFLFLNPAAPDFFPEWEKVADDCVAYLRASAALDPYDERLQTLIGELSTRSEVFRSRWADHNVRFHRSGTKYLRHPLIGEVILDFEAFEIAADSGLRLNTYTAAPDSPSAQALGLLASWVATPAEPLTVRQPD
jgi:transcriptional regulator with XRE-family HTH domain